MGSRHSIASAAMSNVHRVPALTPTLHWLPPSSGVPAWTSSPWSVVSREVARSAPMLRPWHDNQQVTAASGPQPCKRLGR